MSKSSSKVRKALNNPAVQEKLKYLGENWEALPKADRTRCVDEMAALGCTDAVIADAVGVGESTIRYYRTPSKAAPASTPETTKKKMSLPRFNLESLGLLPSDLPAPLSVAPIKTRREKIKEALQGYLERFCGGPHLILQALDLAGQRCDEMEVCGTVPRPLPLDVEPEAVLAQYEPDMKDFDPGTIEHLAASLLELLPKSLERGQFLKELRCEYRGLW